MAHRAGLLVVLGAALLGACAQKPPALRIPAAPAVPATDVDGIYRGTSTRFRADARACPSPGIIVLRVVNGLFQYRWNGHTEVDATITPDGAVQGALGDISLGGRLAGERIEGDVQSPSCAYHFRAARRKN